MRPNNHVYTPGDGKSMFCQVYVNGVPIKRAVYADTRAGIVRVVDDPIRIHKYGKRVLTSTIRGTVTVSQVQPAFKEKQK